MQTVTSSSESERTRAPRIPPRTAIIAAAGLAAVVVLLLVVRATQSGVLSDVVLAGEQVGGMDRAQLESTVARLARASDGEMLTAELDGRSRSASAATIGSQVDVDATVDAVWRRGRQVNPFAMVADRLHSAFGTITVAAVTTVDDTKLARWVDGAVAALEQPPTEGSVAFDGVDVQRTNPGPGTRPTPASLREGTLAALDERGAATVAFETEDVEPVTTTGDVDALVTLAQRIVSAPVELTRRDETLSIEPETLGGLYTVVQRRDGDAVALDLGITRGALAEVFTDKVRKAFETTPRDATVELTGGGPKVRNGRNGFAIDLAAARSQIDTLARTAAGDGDARSAELEGRVTEPDRTTKDAKQLQITQKVSSFTTNHACCQGRVTNIHRFADLMDGVLIEPDETFSLNGHVGKRTREKGFVGGGAIQQGEYVDEVGGGVSQFATTFFNAAYFGGYEIVEHKPHSYYISRYPAGRESTINYPTVDVKIRNDSPYGILVDTSYTDTSITVTFWGKKWVDVSSSSGEPHNHTSPQTEERTNADLEPGSERVIQSGSTGFDIVVTRTLRYDDGRNDTQEFFTRYLPEPRIVERGPDAPADDEEDDTSDDD